VLSSWAAQANYFARLKFFLSWSRCVVAAEAQQLHLQMQRNIAQFIEEQGAARRRFDESSLALAGTGESAFLVTEQFQRCRVPSESRPTLNYARSWGSRARPYTGILALTAHCAKTVRRCWDAEQNREL